jgi:hypothetical protein
MYSIWHLTINFCCLQSPQFHISTAPAQRTPGIGPGLTWWTCRSLPPASPWGSDILEIGLFDLDCKVMEQRTHSERNMSNTHIYILHIYNYIYIHITFVTYIWYLSCRIHIQESWRLMFCDGGLPKRRHINTNAIQKCIKNNQTRILDNI